MKHGRHRAIEECPLCRKSIHIHADAVAFCEALRDHIDDFVRRLVDPRTVTEGGSDNELSDAASVDR